MSRNIATTLVLASLGCALAGCGYNPGGRAASGGLIGAGAVGRAVTSPDDVNLGQPV